jgi:hypothetical protein
MARAAHIGGEMERNRHSCHIHNEVTFTGIALRFDGIFASAMISQLI